MKCSGNFIMGLFERTAELNVDVESRGFTLNSRIFIAKFPDRVTRKKKRHNNNLMFEGI